MMALVSKRLFGKVTLVTNRGFSGGLGGVWRKFGFWYKETMTPGQNAQSLKKIALQALVRDLYNVYRIS